MGAIYVAIVYPINAQITRIAPRAESRENAARRRENGIGYHHRGDKIAATKGNFPFATEQCVITAYAMHVR